MADRETTTQELGAFLHRTVLGVLLAVLFLVSIRFVNGSLADGQYLSGILGVTVALIAGYWILGLFREQFFE